MIIESEFTPARWLKNRHAQTIYPSDDLPVLSLVLAIISCASTAGTGAT
jgi:hypothetical protein